MTSATMSVRSFTGRPRQWPHVHPVTLTCDVLPQRRTERQWGNGCGSYLYLLTHYRVLQISYTAQKGQTVRALSIQCVNACVAFPVTLTWTTMEAKFHLCCCQVAMATPYLDYVDYQHPLPQSNTSLLLFLKTVGIKCFLLHILPHKLNTLDILYHSIYNETTISVFKNSCT